MPISRTDVHERALLEAHVVEEVAAPRAHAHAARHGALAPLAPRRGLAHAGHVLHGRRVVVRLRLVGAVSSARTQTK